MDLQVILKTRPEIQRIERAARPIRRLFRSLRPIIVPGLAVRQLRDYCVEFLAQAGVRPALRGFNGYPEDLCISINSVAAHGILFDGVLGDGDLLTIDITTVLGGWHADAAWSYPVGKTSPQVARLLRCAWQASAAGVKALKAGGYLSAVGEAVEACAERHGCRVLPNFVGHGIGEGIHEDPKVLHTAVNQLPTPVVPGMVLTVEPIITLGDTATKVLPDGWSQTTSDGKLTAQFEHTVAVFADEVRVLTLEDQGLIDLDFPPFVY